jgi:hypothetical protein
MIEIADGLAKHGDYIWIVVFDELKMGQIGFISEELVIVSAHHYSRNSIKELGFMDKRKAEMYMKLRRDSI